MRKPSEKTTRRLFAMSGNMCAFPECQSPIFEPSGTPTGEICHIRAQSPGGPRYDPAQTDNARHSYENLILLCRRHHKVVDAQPDIYATDVLEEMKRLQGKQFGRPESDGDGIFAKVLLNALPSVEINNNSGNVVIGSPGAVIAGTINFKSSNKTQKILPPRGTIGSDQAASRYVLHLINRYNEFASADKSRVTAFKFGAISKNITDNFRSPWRVLPMEKFSEVCLYLQERINKTRVAKANASKGHRSFSSFDEFSGETKPLRQQ